MQTVTRLALIAAGLCGATVHATASDAGQTPRSLANRYCMHNGAPDGTCVAAYLEGLDYTDDYLRGLHHKRAAARMASLRRAEEQAAQAKAAAQASAQRIKDCAAQGLTLDAVTIGMPSTAVTACGWGKPSRVVRTTTAEGITENWQYPGQRELVLFNRRVTVIRE